MTRTLITGATIVGGPGGGDLLIEGDVIAAIGVVDARDAEVIDARGLHLAPGIIDIGVFAVEAAACAAGGITRVAPMPDGNPPLDDPGLVQRASLAAKPQLWVHPLAAATRGLAGHELGEFALMAKAGARAVATGRGWVADAGVMRRVLAYAGSLGLTVIAHAEDDGLVAGAVATAGETATRHGYAAAPSCAEAMAVARDLALVADTGGAIHFRVLSTAAAFELVREAKARLLPVTCGTTPAYAYLSDIATLGFRTFARLSPALRSEADRQATRAAIADGTVDILCSSHDPRGPEAKRLPFPDAEPGASGAETLLALGLGLVRDELIDSAALFAMLSTRPAALLRVDAGRIAVGAPADLVLYDVDRPWVISERSFKSSAGNTPFDGLPVQGRVVRTIKGGRTL